MRKLYSNQLRLDRVPIEQVTLNLESRDRIVPVLRALQFVYADRSLLDQVLNLIASDVNSESRTDTGRPRMDYWHICVLVAARLRCDYTYDQLQDLAENHRNLRAIPGLGECDETEFKWRTIRNNIGLLRPETISQISQLIVKAGHETVKKISRSKKVPPGNISTSIVEHILNIITLKWYAQRTLLLCRAFKVALKSLFRRQFAYIPDVELTRQIAIDIPQLS